MNTHSLRSAIHKGAVILAAAIIGTSAIGMARANDAAPTSTVGTPPEPAPASTIGDPPSLPAVLSHVENVIAPERMMNIHGIAFEDLNANGKRDAGEPAFNGAWFKLSGGGNWFVCGNAAGNGAFGMPVKTGAYHIQPINVQGFRVTTPQIDVPALGAQPMALFIGYARDANVITESCDAYHPSRPLK
jgi:hypothetical protein